MLYTVTESREVDTQTGLISDETYNLQDIMLLRSTLIISALLYMRTLETEWSIASSQTTSRLAITAAEKYQERGQIEIFFKWIKQHLHIKTFYSTTRNAVYTQIWIAICDYLLLIIAKKQYGLKPSLHTISNSIGQILFKGGDI